MEEIRLRAWADLGGCVDALREVHAAEGYPVNWPEQPQQWLTAPDLRRAWVAVAEGEVLGQVAVTAGTSYDALLRAAGCSNNEFACVSQLFVRPSVAGRGLGRRLIGVAREFASRYCLQLGLEVLDRPDSPAVALYEHLGWRLVGRAAARWTGPDGSYPWLRLYLAPPAALDGPRTRAPT